MCAYYRAVFINYTRIRTHALRRLKNHKTPRIFHVKSPPPPELQVFFVFCCWQLCAGTGQQLQQYNVIYTRYTSNSSYRYLTHILYTSAVYNNTNYPPNCAPVTVRDLFDCPKVVIIRWYLSLGPALMCVGGVEDEWSARVGSAARVFNGFRIHQIPQRTDGVKTRAGSEI